MARFRAFLLASAFVFALPLSTAMAQDDDPSLAGGSADPNFEGNAGVIVLNGLQVTVRQDLDFGVIAPSLTEFGTVQVNRGRNFRSVCGSTLICLEPGNRARFTVSGDPGRVVLHEDPGSITVSDNAGNTMTVDTFVGAGSGNDNVWRGWQRIRDNGIVRFNVGATLHVKPNQPPGIYTGTFSFSIEYE
ncbi:MAG: DUF4402 domain-containing protein [Pseudomonadota bacterium]